MWEKPRVDSKKKLKRCAVPTIFSTNKEISSNIVQMDSTSANVDVNSTTLNRTGDEELSVDLVEQDIEEIKSSNDNVEYTSKILNETETAVIPIMSPIAKPAIPVQLNINEENVKKLLEMLRIELRKLYQKRDRHN
ncbi:uncharacterized protein LOC109504180 isoform X2 [Harpegnathos saltator]|uniref:uncharacterized protein LOC109504180 isoform X2 n=1 Tax=Harpegnathos saltator TaxID=610380 RepID=UPI000DBED72D|nr:uncharacterized protein LOC109504180 isoform X2 [Harpegnathos saltator]